jgi:hypothetical protein
VSRASKHCERIQSIRADFDAFKPNAANNSRDERAGGSGIVNYEGGQTWIWEPNGFQGLHADTSMR